MKNWILKTMAVALLSISATGFADMHGKEGKMQKFNTEAFAKAQKDGKKIALQYHLSSCSTCKKQETVLNEIMKDSQFKDVVFMQADFAADAMIKEKHAVKGQSTLILFKGDKEIARSQGINKKDGLLTELAKLN